MIEINNLTKKYGEQAAVDNISLKVNQGEILGFLGPNGAGKTTTLRVVACYMPATMGTVSVMGYDVYQSPLQVREKIGYLPETNPLYPEMGVVEYLCFIAKLRNIPSGKIKASVREVIQLCGLAGVIGKNIGELSRGFKQRVGLAQAIIHNPSVLILDEPTLGLDPNQIVEIRELIKKLGKEKTVILSSHILSEVQATCDRVVIINKGKIVADGKKEELQSMVRGGERIYLKLKGKDKQAVMDFFSSQKDIFNVSIKKEEPDSIEYELDIQKGVDLREKVFYWTVKNKWVILEMIPEKVSLEDVFRKLTIEEGKA
ncbi:ATP-binding cassette domain-containing protein [bacterium]|nr:ATP-binding cassette domain-containing protein [bacterium]